MYLNVDTKKILDSKTPKNSILMEAHNIAKTTTIPKYVINFMSLYKTSSKDTILENLNTLWDINSDITFTYANNILECADIPESTLIDYKAKLSTLVESTEDESYIERLNNSISKIDSVVENINNMETIIINKKNNRYDF